MIRRRLFDLLFLKFVYSLPKKHVSSKSLNMLNFFHICNQNMIWFFLRDRRELGIIADINDLFLRLHEGIVEQDLEGEYIFFSRAYSSWMAALRIGLGHQISDCFTLLRASLEIAVYGHFMLTAEDSRYLKIWIKRKDEHGKILKEFRDNFKWPVLTERIESPDIKFSARTLYEHVIDFGAHPNVIGMLQGVSRLGTGSDEFLMVGASKSHRKISVFYMMWIGITVLGILAEVFPEASDQVNLIEDLQKLGKRFTKYSQPFFTEVGIDNSGDEAERIDKEEAELALEILIFGRRGKLRESEIDDK